MSNNINKKKHQHYDDHHHSADVDGKLNKGSNQTILLLPPHNSITKKSKKNHSQNG